VLLILAFHVAGQGSELATRWWGRFAFRFDVGVTIFFVVSGFLLYRPFVAARLGEVPRPRLLAYARRRALRILPAYWLALTVLAIYPGLGGVFTDHWFAYYGFLQIYNSDWLVFFQGITQAWSLCVEVTFYAALPLLAGLMLALPARHRRARVRNEVLLLAVLAVGSIVYRVVLHTADPKSVWAQTLPGLYLWFAIGMALAVASAALHGADSTPWPVRVIASRPLACWLAAVGLFILASEIGRSVSVVPAATEGRAIVEYVLYGAISLFVVLPAVFGEGRGGLPRRFLANPLVARLGLISYGIFLWHVAILSKLSDWGVKGFVPLFVFALALSVACAATSYYLVERPLLRFKDRRRTSRDQEKVAIASTS
jgi:peptidoglycan/LPS O-acetylase OafA/YrhL